MIPDTYGLRQARRGMRVVAENSLSLARGWRKGNAVSAFWSIGFRKGYRNFGDLLTRELLREYGLNPVWCPPGHAGLLAAGSILQLVDSHYRGCILGSGLISDISHPLPIADVRAVRGLLTAERIGAPDDVLIGDPGLLAERLIPQRHSKDFVLGLVPHYEDKLHAVVQYYAQQSREKVLVIDVQQKPADVIHQIDRCQHVLSSSLHGLIVADALGIPAGWILFSDRLSGGGFKFRDYQSALGESFEAHRLVSPSPVRELVKWTRLAPETIGVRKQTLDVLFRTLAEEVQSGRKAA